MNWFIFIGFAGCMSAAVGCRKADDGTSGPRTQSNQVIATKNAAPESLRSSGVMLPDGAYEVDPQRARAEEQAARAIEGDRGVFRDMHDHQGVTLLPVTSRLSLSSGAEVPSQTVNETLQCDAAQMRQACATACATATANAHASAFAHASATACAWAQAWACVFTFSPFQQVCRWASSTACVTSFSTAFMQSFQTDTKTVCATQCK